MLFKPRKLEQTAGIACLFKRGLGHAMKKICTIGLGRWTATVNKIEPGDTDARPSATHGFDLRCDGVLFGSEDNGMTPSHVQEPLDINDLETPEEWAETVGLEPLTEQDSQDAMGILQGGYGLLRHIERGGSVDEWLAKETRRQSLAESFQHWVRGMTQRR
jgi:hypothetical protein